MNRSINVIAYALYGLALLISVPAAVFLVFDGIRRVRARFFPTPVASTSVPNPDAILMMLDGIARSFAGIEKLGGFVGNLIATVLAALSVIALVLATLFFLTARGLQHEQTWARFAAAGVMSNLIFVALPLIVSRGNKRPLRIAIGVLLVSAGIAGLRALWLGYDM